MTLSVFQATITNENGDILPGAEVSVILESTGLAATIYSTRGGAALSNPFFADASGFAQFYANAGEYRIVATSGVFSRTWRYVRLGSGGATDVGTAATKNTDELVTPVNSVADLAGFAGTKDDQQISLKGWHPDSDVGGGILYWDAAKPKSEHNGGTVFSPTVPFSAITGDYLDGVGETDAGGSGCWVRLGYLITPVQYGAKGDSVTDDNSSIDIVNSVNSVVDLQGLTYKYSGALTVLAFFKNGKIIADTGEFDYSDPETNSARTITVGASGTIKRLDTALDYLKTLRINTRITLKLLEHNTPNDSTGSMALHKYIFDHPDSYRVVIEGELIGSVPVNNDLTGDKSLDLAFCQSKYSASIYLTGNDTTVDSSGLVITNGLAQIKEVLIESHCRYSIDVGFNSAHTAARTNSRGLSYSNVTVFGGVWGTILAGCELNLLGTNMFAHQFSRGPIDLTHGATVYVDNGDTYFFSPTVTQGTKNADQCLYGINCESGTVKFPHNKLHIKGSFVHGIKGRGTSYIYASGMRADGVLSPVTAEDNTYFLAENGVFENTDESLFNLVPANTQVGTVGKSQNGIMMFSGGNSTVVCHNVSINNCKPKKYMHADGGKFLGWLPVNVDSSQVTERPIVVEAGNCGVFGMNITNTLNAGNDRAEARRMGKAFLRVHSGMAFLPAINTESFGGGIYSDQ